MRWHAVILVFLVIALVRILECFNPLHLVAKNGKSGLGFFQTHQLSDLIEIICYQRPLLCGSYATDGSYATCGSYVRQLRADK